MNPRNRPTALAVATTPASLKLLLREIHQVRGLMPLLIRQRNNRRWSPEERAELKLHLRRLTSISPYLLVLALPGSFLMLPARVWWSARRRSQQLLSAASRK